MSSKLPRMLYSYVIDGIQVTTTVNVDVVFDSAVDRLAYLYDILRKTTEPVSELIGSAFKYDILLAQRRAAYLKVH